MPLNIFCSHRRTTFPQTLRQTACGRAAAAEAPRPYVACLECGKEFPYNWERMRIEPSTEEPVKQMLAGVAANWIPPAIRLFWQRAVN